MSKSGVGKTLAITALLSASFMNSASAGDYRDKGSRDEFVWYDNGFPTSVHRTYAGKNKTSSRSYQVNHQPDLYFSPILTKPHIACDLTGTYCVVTKQPVGVLYSVPKASEVERRIYPGSHHLYNGWGSYGYYRRGDLPLSPLHTPKNEYIDQDTKFDLEGTASDSREISVGAVHDDKKGVISTTFKGPHGQCEETGEHQHHFTLTPVQK